MPFRFFTLEALAHWVAWSYVHELGVFIGNANYVIVTETTVDISFLDVLAVPNPRGRTGVTLFEI